MKVKLFTHTDLDGVVSNLIACTYFIWKGCSISTERCGYDNIDKNILGYINSWEYDPDAVIFISDISPSYEVFCILDNLPNPKILIDHHQTAMDKIDVVETKSFPWAYIQEGDSASLLVMKYLLQQVKSDTSEKGVKMLESLRAYYDLVYLTDLWDCRSRESEEYIANLDKITRLNGLFSALGWFKFKDRFIANPSIETTEVEDAMVDMLLRIKKNVMRYTRVYCLKYNKEDKNALYGLGFANDYTSDVAEYIFSQYTELLFVVLINMNGCTGSLRRNSKHELCESTDLQELAKQFDEGGGGHPFAAGFSFNIDNYHTIINRVVTTDFYI